MLSEAIRNSDIVPEGQKKVLDIICSSPYPLSAKSIEKTLSSSKQSANFSLRSLLSRNFIIKEKDAVFVYKPNETRVIELIERYKNTLNIKSS